jgi:hypothetical protein
VSNKAVQIRAQHRYTDDVVSLRRLSTHAPRAACREEVDVAKEGSYPKKYWWVVVVALPIVLAVIAVLPGLLKSSNGSSTPSVSVTGDGTIVNYGYLENNTFVTNVEVIAREYEAHTGRPLDDDLKRQIEQAVSAALKNDHTQSVRLFEQIAQSAPVPAIYNNLGVEYGIVQNVAASQNAFALAKAKVAEVAKAPPLSATQLKPPPVSGSAIRFESSSVPAMVIEPLSPPYQAPAEIHVVDHGTATGGSYQVKYKPTPDTPVVMNAGTYDVMLKSSGSHGAGFVVASKVEVKEGSLTRVNPNALVGGIALEPLAREGFPALKQLQLIDRSSGDKRLLAQSTDKLGVVLPLAAGSYDVVCTTADDQSVIVENVTVKAGVITRIDTPNQLAAIVVHSPDVRTELKAVYALTAGTNRIESKVDAFEKPLLVAPGKPYDVALEQAAGLTHLRKAIVLKPGELMNIK